MEGFIRTPSGVQRIPPVAGGGGPAIGTGTYAARPASPTEGDSYTVTSGVRRGSVYRCEVAGTWSLVTVALPQLGACVGLFDGERGAERAGSLLRRWVNLSPRGRGYDLTWMQLNAPQPVTAVGATGLLAYDTTGTLTAVRGVLPTAVASGARTVAVLCRPTGPFNGDNGNPNFNVIAGWGAGVTAGAFDICARANYVDTWGLHYVGSANESATSCVEVAPVVVVATYDGTNARIYREGTLIHTHTVALTGNGADGYFGVMCSYSGGEPAAGLLHFAGAWDIALDAGEITTLTALLRERYGL